jgi:hypothetical protein
MRIFSCGPKQTKQKAAQENQQQQTTERGRSPNKNNQQHSHQGTEKRENLPMSLHFKAKETNSCALNLHKGCNLIVYLTRLGKTQSPLRTPSARHHHNADCKKGQESRKAIVPCSHE